ncbi:MAG: thioredoxin family protein [Chthoniobacteraceae bacterium]
MNLRLISALALTFALSAPLFAKGGWEDDFEKGLAKAKASGKPALVDFTGSDWCHWCKVLDAEIFSKAEFKDYVKDKYELVMVDFPQIKPLPKAQADANNKLAEKYKIEGFPTVLVLDGDGKVLGRLGYMEGGPKAFIAELEKFVKK